MLKRLFILSSLILAVLIISQGQPVIGQGSMFQNGDYWQTIKADTTGVIPGPAGANQNWNFSNLQPAGTPFNFKIISPSSTPYYSSFPSASMCEFDSTNNAYSYLKFNSPNLQMIGYVQGSGVITEYTDPMDYMSYPLSYLYSHNDTYLSHYSYQGYDFYNAGDVQYTADGYGTLTLPTGTFYNVIRLKSTQNIKNYNSIPGMGDTTYSTMTSYVWYCNDYPQHLLFMYTTNYMGMTSKVVSYADAAPLGVSDLKFLGLKLFPNPCTNYIQIENQLSEPVKYSIYGMAGKELLNGSVSKTDNRVNVSKLPEGMYFIILNGEKRTMAKFSIVR